MSTGKREASQSARAPEEALRAASQSAQLADAAMALLGCRSADDVYEVIADFMLLLAPGAVVIVNEASPDLEWLITRKVAGMSDSLLMKAAELVGFEIIGKRSAVAPAHRGELLGGALSTVPGGFAELASFVIPRPLARAGATAFRLHDVFSIGIADGRNVLGNVQIYTRAPGVVLPTHVIESFTRHCYSALASIAKVRELAESAENNRLLLRNMTEGLALHEIVLDESGTPCDYRYLDVNPAYEAATGLKADDIIGRTLREVLPGVEASWLERYRAVVTTGVAARFEDYSGDLDRYFEVAAYSPQPGQLATVGMDITARKRADQARLENEARLDLALRSAGMGVWHIDVVANRRVFDEQVCRLLGIDPATFAGSADEFFGALHPDDVEKVRAALTRTIEQDAPYEPEYRAVWPDGSVHWLTARGRLIRGDDGRPARINGILWDVTAREIADEALRASELKYRSLVENTSDVVFCVDDKGAYQFVNQVFASTFGETPAFFIGKTFWDIYPDELADLRQAANRRLFETGEVQAVEVSVPLPDKTLYFIAKANPIRDEAGAVIMNLTSATDITERKRIERELVEEQERSVERLSKSLSSIIQIVSQVAETRDPYTAGHQRRVSELAVRLSEGMGMSAEQIEEIRIAALLHDIGKMSVPAEILSRPGALSPLEFELVKGHSEAGYLIIAAAEMEGPTAEIVHQHHERCDGSGYPRGLDGNELLLESKVLMVADVVEAIMSHRPYRAALGRAAALAEIEQGSGRLYEPRVVEACLRLFRETEFAFSEE
jgi:PAS domain S-box-containing protein